MGRLKILGGKIVTDHRTQLTNAITDSATNMKMGVQNKYFFCLCERSEQKNVRVVPPIVTSWGYISRKWSQKFSNEFLFGGKMSVFRGGQLPHVPLAGYVTALEYNARHWLELYSVIYQ